MAVLPEVRTFLDEIAAAGAKPWNQMTPAEARETWHTVTGLFAGPAEPVAAIEDRLIPGPGGDIPLRAYTPEGGPPLPALIYFHGGGWVVGTTDTYHVSSRALANATGCKVIFPTYRMAPEYKYPAAVEDCYATLKWVAENAAAIGVDAQRIVVAGDSAGGNLAAAVALMARDRGGPAPAFQLLLYPATDADGDTPSAREFAEGYLLLKDDMPWFWNHYLPNKKAADEAYASPLRAKDFSGLPPALVVTAECDVLRDEGEDYAARLKKAGVPVTQRRVDGTIHGFLHPLEGRFAHSKAVLAEIGAEVKKALGS